MAKASYVAAKQGEKNETNKTKQTMKVHVIGTWPSFKV
jgi:hypothetical protein